MKWIRNLLKKKDKKNQSKESQHKVEIDDDGKVSMELSFNVNNSDLKIPIKTTADNLVRTYNNNLDPNSCDREPSVDEIKLPVKTPIYKMYGDNKDKELIFNAQEIARLNGYNYFVAPKDKYERLLKSTEEHEKANEILKLTAELNNKGIALEKENKIDEAITIYEENVKLKYPASHSYDRLMILYRKKQDIQNEKRIIELAIQIFSGKNATLVSKYEQRLKKLIS